jgi:hypothetical protein
MACCTCHTQRTRLSLSVCLSLFSLSSFSLLSLSLSLSLFLSLSLSLSLCQGGAGRGLFRHFLSLNKFLFSFFYFYFFLFLLFFHPFFHRSSGRTGLDHSQNLSDLYVSTSFCTSFCTLYKRFIFSCFFFFRSLRTRRQQRLQRPAWRAMSIYTPERFTDSSCAVRKCRCVPPKPCQSTALD